MLENKTINPDIAIIMLEVILETLLFKNFDLAILEMYESIYDFVCMCDLN